MRFLWLRQLLQAKSVLAEIALKQRLPVRVLVIEDSVTLTHIIAPVTKDVTKVDGPVTYSYLLLAERKLRYVQVTTLAESYAYPSAFIGKQRLTLFRPSLEHTSVLPGITLSEYLLGIITVGPPLTACLDTLLRRFLASQTVIIPVLFTNLLHHGGMFPLDDLCILL